MKNQKFDFLLPTETDFGISFTESVREVAFPGAYWIWGEVDKYLFSVLLLGEKTKWGIEKGRIFKLSIRDTALKEVNNKFLASCVVNCDKGWDIRLSKSAQPYFNKTKLWIENHAD